MPPSPTPRPTRCRGRATPTPRPRPARRPGACTTTTRRPSTACAARCMRAGRSRAWCASTAARSPPGASRTRADLTFSVAKTYLALLAGVAQGHGLLPDEDEPVVARLPGIGFDSAHNRSVTWAQLLTQTSEWEGTSFGLPDTVDRWRKVAQDPRPAAGPKGGARPLQAPGSYWEYNDVRINQLALALLHLFRRPLPEVFLEQRAAAARRRRRLRLARLRRRLGRAARRRPGAVGAGRHALGRRRLDQRPRPGAHRPAAAGRRRRRRPAADPERLDREDEGALADRAVLRPAALAEPRRQGLPGRVDAMPSSWSAPAATTSGSIPGSTRWWCCAGSTRPMPR